MSQAGKLAADLSTALRCSELVNDSSIYSPESKYRNKFMSDRYRGNWREMPLF